MPKQDPSKQDPRAPFEAGFARRDITLWEPELAMMGWGMYWNRIRGSATPLHARAAVIRDAATGNATAFVVADLLFVSQAVRTRVLERLAVSCPDLDAASVVLTASHTHSGPSGISHYFFMNLNGPGYSEPVFDGVVDGIAGAIEDAWAARQPATMHCARDRMPMTEAIVFNRSWFAYSQNRDVDPVPRERREEAVDRTMTLLALRSTETDKWLGSINWFPVHGTSVHSDNHMLHADNKGLAATDWEAEMAADNPGYVAVFAQEAAGDVTPNYRYDAKRKLVVGRFDDDFESAQFVADAQRRMARGLLNTVQQVAGPIDARLQHVDFACAKAEAVFTDGTPRATTSPVMGLSMAQGTSEGPGPLLNKRWLPQSLGAIKRRRTGDPKWPMVELGRGINGRFLGMLPVRRLGLLSAADPALSYLSGCLKEDAIGDAPWIGHHLPMQIVRVGPLALVSVPFEVTTVSGRRIRATVADVLEIPAEDVIISCYANGYSGYLTTHEEYMVQHYEAGYTVFGPWQLAAVRTALSRVATALRAGAEIDAGPQPHEFNREELMRRRFHAGVAWGPPPSS